MFITILWMQALLAVALPARHRMDNRVVVRKIMQSRTRSFVDHESPMQRRRLMWAMLAHEHDNVDGVLIENESLSGSNDDGGSDPPMPAPPLTKIPSRLIPTLDLAPLMAHVASYACTSRGKEAIIDLASTPSSEAASIFGKTRDGRKPSLFGNNQRQRRQDWFDGSRQAWKRDRSSLSPVAVAQSAGQATSEYELVHQAMVILQSQQSENSTIPLPPMFQLNAGVSSTVDSDDDEWIDLCISTLPPGMDLYQEIDLETILKAEQVLKLLVETYEWAMSERIKENATGLVEIAQKMELHDEEADARGEKGTINHLSDLYQTLKGAVEIVRISDIVNRFSFQFQLARDGRFPELNLLKAKEDKLLGQKKDNSQQLAIIREEISILENQIKRNLIASMICAAPDVQRGMNALARLDTAFARASFGCDWGGVIPEVTHQGRIQVEKFVHPVLALEKDVVNGSEGNKMPVVPVDLILPGKGGYQALMISGPNGGGKTLALKSFGLVAMMAKLGIPITTIKGSQNNSLSVDFFEEVLVEVGDSQSISKHESTLMARLNALASLIQRTDSNSDDANLVLLDELGGGTDPVAGSALAQSILEKLISTSPMCQLVATTHSPQLKALSINDDRFECASVLTSNEKSPIFQLSYGTTGQSFALEAARRCQPSLPDDVIDRAAELMNGGDGDAADSLRHYLSSLEKDRQHVRELTKETEATWKEVCEIKEDMVSKIDVQKMYLSRLESRLESIFETLKDEETRDAYELVGESMDDLRLLKRKVQTEQELLSEKGLRRVADSHSFYEGEAVVIIKEGEWRGYDAVVKDADDPLAVTVVPVLDLFNDGDAQEDPLVLRRSEVAIFDYPDWGFSDDTYAGTDSYSKQKQTSSNVLSVLSTLSTSKSKASTSNDTKTRENNSFTSARQRKAAKSTAKQKKGNKGKRKK
ncbi:hypothetical protein ACHAXR_005438 [Thalassiosira sp. AJA248-18]